MSSSSFFVLLFHSSALLLPSFLLPSFIFTSSHSIYSSSFTSPLSSFFLFSPSSSSMSAFILLPLVLYSVSTFLHFHLLCRSLLSLPLPSFLLLSTSTSTVLLTCPLSPFSPFSIMSSNLFQVPHPIYYLFLSVYIPFPSLKVIFCICGVA